MSLIYRLPLTNNLNNYGLYNGINYGYNLANQSDGKVGKCYSFGKSTTLAALTDSSGNFITNSQDQIIEVTNSNSSKVNSYIDIETDVAKQLSLDFSFSLWLRIDGWNTSYETYVYGGVGGSPWANYIFGLLRNSTNSTITFVISNGTTSTNTNCTSGTLTTGNWYHITCTYTSGMMRMYVDGTQVKEYATTIAPDFTKIGTFHLGALNPTTYQTNCSMNDFRLYDHCLSPMEVKELSKGLVLHYPLNRGGWGQENLLKGTDTLVITNNINTGVGGWDNISTLTETADGIKLTGRSGSPCIGLPLATTGNINNNEDYTLSFKYRTNKAVSMNFYYIESSGSNISIYNSVPTEVSTTEWKNYSWTINSSTVADRIPKAILMFYSFSSNSSDWIEIKRGSVKLEKGSKATPWLPAPSDDLATQMGLNSNVEYDTSGYCNNGTRIGTFEWISDTPKYNVSTMFNGSNTLIEKEGLPIETKTIACWINWYSLPSGYTIPIHDKQSGLAIGISSINRLISYVGTSSGGTGSCVNVSLVTNQWYHVVVIKTGDTTRDVYINGEKITSIASNNWWGGDINNLYIGGRHYSGSYRDYFNGLISDFRAYATALSADDVKSLYQNSAYIDSSGNVYGAVHSEV